MDQVKRRDFLRAGLALPVMVEAAYGALAEIETTAKPRRFEEVVGFQLAEVVAAHRFAILPLGSLEFHGPHNPLGSDSIIVSGIAEHVAARTAGLLFPTVIFTQCPAHTAYFAEPSPFVPKL